VPASFGTGVRDLNNGPSLCQPVHSVRAGLLEGAA